MKFFLSSMLLWIMAGNASHAESYQAAMSQVTWNFSGDKGVCVLSQDIPLYGKAEFVSHAGQPLRFSISEHRRKAEVVKASLSIGAAPWMREILAGQVYRVYWEGSGSAGHYGRLSVYGETAEAMLDALLDGQYPVFTYVRAASASNLEEHKVAVSSIKFSVKYKEFLTCRHQAGLALTASMDAMVSSRKKRRG